MSFSQKQIEHTVSLYAEPFSTRTLLKCNYLSCIFPFSFSFNPRSSFFSQEEQNSRKKAVFEENILFSYCVQIFEMKYTLEGHIHKQRKTLSVHPLETAPSLYRFSRILKKFSSSPPLQPSSSLYQAIVGWPGGHSFNIHRILRPGRFLEAFPVR